MENEGTKLRRYDKVIKMVSLRITTLGGWRTMNRGVKAGGYLLALICQGSSFRSECAPYFSFHSIFVAFCKASG